MDDAGEIGGYRVLRRLAVGERCRVLLAHQSGAVDPVVLKVASADDAAAVREAEALDRGSGEHVVPVLDACADDDRIVLVLPRLPGPDLARVLAERAELEGGEAVTILAPVAGAVARLHAAGVAHGALGTGSVLFDAEGAPVLIGFGAASVFEAGLPEVELERVPGVAADRAALRSIATGVLGRVGGVRRATARRLLERLGAAADAEVADLVATEVFDVAAALPVRFADPPGTPGPRDGGAAGAGVGGRLVPVSRPVAGVEVPDVAPAATWAARVAALLDRSPAAELAAALRRRWAALSAGRRRLTLGVGAAALALVVAVVAVPGAPAPGAAAGPVRSASPDAPRSTRSPGAGGEAASTDTGAAGDDDAVRGDDPALAATALLRARERCRRELSVLCLDDVDQDGSSAAADDREAIRAAQAGGELPSDPLDAAGRAGAAPPRLTERLGGSALIAVAGGASLLIVRGDGGWRIRDILGPPSASPAPPPGG
jgi:hypothetical protein